MVVGLAALMASGCIGIGDPPEPQCACPELESAVASVDWTGDGRGFDDKLVREGFPEVGERPLSVLQIYANVSDDDLNALFDSFVSTMAEVGFVPDELSGAPGRHQSAPFTAEHWHLLVSTDVIQDRFQVLVFMDRPDELAAERLAPLTELFGTR